MKNITINKITSAYFNDETTKAKQKAKEILKQAEIDYAKNIAKINEKGNNLNKSFFNNVCSKLKTKLLNQNFSEQNYNDLVEIYKKEKSTKIKIALHNRISGYSFSENKIHVMIRDEKILKNVLVFDLPTNLNIEESVYWVLKKFEIFKRNYL